MNQLDEILKNEMMDFAPDAPNVWSGVQQNISQSNLSSQVGNSANTVITKGTISIIKFASAFALVSSVTAYLYFSNQSNKLLNENSVIDIPKNENKIQNNKMVVIPEITPTVKKEKVQLHKKAENNPYKTEPVISNAVTKNNFQDKTIEVFESNPNVKLPITSEIVTHTDFTENEEEEIKAIEESEKVINNFVEKNNNIGLKEMPNVFSPNADGINDKFVIPIEGENLFIFQVFNHNNELIFESKDKTNSWDGTNQKNGHACPTGVYYGILIYNLNHSEKNKTLMTKISLIR